MKLRLWHLPIRASAGAFILNSGLSKLSESSDDAHKQIHGMAAGVYPQFQSMEPKTFTKVLGAGEIALGAALLAPMVSPGIAGLGLTAFSAGLLGLYLKTPGMTLEDGVRPSHQGIGLAKDSWLLAMGLALMLDRTTGKVKEAVPGRKS